MCLGDIAAVAKMSSPEGVARTTSADVPVRRIWSCRVFRRTLNIGHWPVQQRRWFSPLRHLRSANPWSNQVLLSQTLSKAAIVVGALAAVSTWAAAADVTGAGATFPNPIYSKWADSYKKETGVGINYQSIGSGGGIKAIKDKTVVFGATDAPLSGDDLDKSGLVQFPMVMGGIVPVLNLDGVSPGSLVIDGLTLAKIFLGQVASWDDPAIKALNPGVTLPKLTISVVHRSDGSGTTFNFTNYLSKVSPEWKSKV